MKAIKLCLMLAASVMLMSAPASGGMSGVTVYWGCPTTQKYSTASNGGLVIQFRLEKTNSLGDITFDSAGIQFLQGQTGDGMTPAQLAFSAGLRDTLQAAAAARKQVSVFYKDDTRAVQDIAIAWNVPC